MKFLVLFSIAAFLSVFSLQAQTVTMKSNKIICEIGEELIVAIELDRENDSIGNFSPDGFDVKSSNQKVAVSHLNGKSDYRKTYSYILKPKTVGKIVINSPVVFFGDERKTAAPITVTIEYGGPAAVEKSIDHIKKDKNFVQNPEGSIRFVVAGKIGYVEELIYGRWVLLREMTGDEIEQLKKK